MNSDLLAPAVQQFIIDNTGTAITKLALSKNPFPKVEWQKILSQIAGRTKAKDKLPTWYLHKNIVYPSKISVEQTSSELTASFKASLVSGKSLIDLTGGFGVDAYHFSKTIESVVHCELNHELSEIVRHNAAVMHANNITFFTGDSADALEISNVQFDWIYIDPSRRNEAKGKVFMLRDCLPNVPENLVKYLQHCNNVLIKTAPILDITAALSELRNVSTIYILAVDNEVKELLWHISKNYSGAITINAVNSTKNRIETFSHQRDKSYVAKYDLPKKYLYEPNAAIMKSGAFEAISAQFDIAKLHQHSHLYTSEKILDNFPGRIFEIQNTLAYTKSDMKQFLEGKKANITVRNFPDKVEVIRRRWKISDGGLKYCFFTTDLNDRKIALICTKINL